MARLGSLSMSKNGPIMYFSAFIASLHLLPSSSLAGLTLRPAVQRRDSVPSGRGPARPLVLAATPRPALRLVPAARPLSAVDGRSARCPSLRMRPEPIQLRLVYREPCPCVPP